METILSTSQETEMINSCKKELSFNLTFSSSLSFVQFPQKHLSMLLFIFSVTFLPLIISVHSFPCAHFSLMSPKATEDPRARIGVCECVSECVRVCPVHQTRSALVLYFVPSESFIERTFPAASAESRLDVWSYSIRI